MGDIYIALGSGGGTSSSDVTATRDKVLSGYTAMTADSDDEPINGTLVDRGAWNGSVAMNSSITIPKGYHNGIGTVAGPPVTQRGAWATNIGINGRANIPEGYHNGQGYVNQSLPVQGGGVYTPGTSNITAVSANRYINGNIVVAGDSRLVPQNIKKGVTIFGVTGTHDGFVPGPNDVFKDGTFGDGYSNIFVGGRAGYREISPNYSTLSINGGVLEVKPAVSTNSYQINYPCLVSKTPINLANYNHITAIVQNMPSTSQSGGAIWLLVYDRYNNPLIPNDSPGRMADDYILSSEAVPTGTLTVDVSNIRQTGYIYMISNSTNSFGIQRLWFS